MNNTKHRKFDGFTTNAWRRKEGEEPTSGEISEIQRNGVPLPIEDKTVNIDVPEKTSELQNDNDFVSRGDVATLSVFKIPGGDGGEETTTVIEEDPNKLSLNYYKNAQGKLSDAVNMTFGDEDYFSLATTAFVQAAISNAVPSVQIDGNWSYKIYPDNTFDACYHELGVSFDITGQSGGWFRSDKLTLALPQSLTDAYDWHIAYASVQAGHNNYPVTCSGPTVSSAGIDYYVLSGNTRTTTGNYTLSAFIRGTVAAKS